MKLSGKTVLITRAAHQSEEFVESVKRSGGVPVVFPTIDVTPPGSWEACDRALDGLYMYDGLIFTSTNAVDFFVQRMFEHGTSLKDLYSKSVFVVGEKTRRAIEKHGCTVTAMPEKFTAMELSRILQQEDLRGKSFLFPRGNLGNTLLADNLKLLGARVDQVVVYETRKPKRENIDHLRSMLLTGGIDVITFTSPSTAKNFASFFTPNELAEIRKQLTVAVIGPVTAEAAESIGFTADVVAEQSSVESLVESIAEHAASKGDTTHSTTRDE